MKKILDLIAAELKPAFEESGYDPSYARSYYPTVQTCVNTSATAPWLRPRLIVRNRLTLLRMW